MPSDISNLGRSFPRLCRCRHSKQFVSNPGKATARDAAKPGLGQEIGHLSFALHNPEHTPMVLWMPSKARTLAQSTGETRAASSTGQPAAKWDYVIVSNREEFHGKRGSKISTTESVAPVSNALL